MEKTAAVSSYGNQADSRDMYQQFYGELQPLKILGINNPTAIIEMIANFELGKIAENILPAEIIKMIAPFAQSFIPELKSYLDIKHETQTAEVLRNEFGIPQSPLAIPTALMLTSRLEKSNLEEIAQANKLESAIQWIQEKIRETLLVWYLAEVTKHEKQLDELDQVQESIAAEKVTTAFATGEATTMNKLVDEKKTAIQKNLSLAQEKLNKFLDSLFRVQFGTVERVVASTQRSFTLPAYDLTQAIPVTDLDLAKAN